MMNNIRACADEIVLNDIVYERIKSGKYVKITEMEKEDARD